jgi:eukaryotic-like serine/threonine-protein kinase
VPILTAQERLGTRLGGRYRIDRVLATGGMSVLFEARDVRAHRPVVLKLLRAEDCMEERRKARFLQEIRLTAELRHPHVVDVLDLGEDETGMPYLVMELLHGHSLQAELADQGTLDFERTLAMLLPVMEALCVVHDAGVVHRDIKPDNIFLHVDPRGAVVPKLLDFGIAKDPSTPLATRTGAVLGTPDYMAPEQLLAGVVGPPADIWAVGAVLYRVLSGQTPFHAETSAHVIARLTREAAPPLRVPGLASPICAAIDRALAREVADRYADMRAFSAALVLCAQEAGYAVPATPARFTPSAVSLVQRTITAPSRSLELPATSRHTLRRVALAGLALIAVSASAWALRAPLEPVARAPIAARAPARAATHEATPVRLAAVADPRLLASRLPDAVRALATSSGTVAAPAAANAPEQGPRKVAHSARPTTRPRPAAPAVHVHEAAPAVFSKAGAGDLPMAVEW